MSTFLFNETIFGPVKSRRLGMSLGINLLPTNIKYCNFNCIYCECGWNQNTTEKIQFPTRNHVAELLISKLISLKKARLKLDAITFAGNGEPTLHPEFSEIIDDTINIRNKYFPQAKTAVLSNATKISDNNIFNALSKIDDNILKLDSAINETIIKLNNPNNFKGIDFIVKNLKKFKGNFILQTMFVKGQHNNTTIDNTTDKELNAWLSLLPELNPKLIMIYTIARDTPADSMEKINIEKLQKIAAEIKKKGFNVQVSA